MSFCFLNKIKWLPSRPLKKKRFHIFCKVLSLFLAFTGKVHYCPLRCCTSLLCLTTRMLTVTACSALIKTLRNYYLSPVFKRHIDIVQHDSVNECFWWWLKLSLLPLIVGLFILFQQFWNEIKDCLSNLNNSPKSLTQIISIWSWMLNVKQERKHRFVYKQNSNSGD